MNKLNLYKIGSNCDNNIFDRTDKNCECIGKNCLSCDNYDYYSIYSEIKEIRYLKSEPVNEIKEIKIKVDNEILETLSRNNFVFACFSYFANGRWLI